MTAEDVQLVGQGGKVNKPGLVMSTVISIFMGVLVAANVKADGSLISVGQTVDDRAPEVGLHWPVSSTGPADSAKWLAVVCKDGEVLCNAVPFQQGQSIMLSECVFLVKGISGISSGPFKRLSYDHLYAPTGRREPPSLEKQNIDLSLGRTSSGLYFSDINCRKTKNAVCIDVVWKVDGVSNTLETLSFYDQFNVIWAGDLNNDGVADLLISFSVSRECATSGSFLLLSNKRDDMWSMQKIQGPTSVWCGPG